MFRAAFLQPDFGAAIFGQPCADRIQSGRLSKSLCAHHRKAQKGRADWQSHGELLKTDAAQKIVLFIPQVIIKSNPTDGLKSPGHRSGACSFPIPSSGLIAGFHGRMLSVLTF
jgi:hypothetical protein